MIAGPSIRMQPDSSVPSGSFRRDERHPRDVDSRLSVFVADLGHGFDQPIALDYRLSAEKPRVLTLHWRARDGRNRWVEIAPDMNVLADARLMQVALRNLLGNAQEHSRLDLRGRSPTRAGWT